MNFIKKYFFRDPSQKWFWLFLALLIKTIPFLLLLHNKPINDIPGFWGGAQGDASSYLGPIENFVKYGNYNPDFRMPGYGIVFYPLLLLFSLSVSSNIMIIIQLIVASASVYYLALCAKNIFPNTRIFYIVFYLYLISYYSNFYDAYIQTESFCISALIFASYFFSEYYLKNTKRSLLYTALLVCWVVFLRPVYLPIPFLFAGLIVLNKKITLSTRFKNTVLVLLPFLICDGAWVIRNYNVHKKFIPLTISALYPYTATSYLQPLLEFGQSWGGWAHITDDIGKSLNWFDYDYPGRIKPTHIDSLPDDIFTSQFNRDSLIHVKRLIEALQNPNIDRMTEKIYQNELRSKLTSYRQSIIHEQPFNYYILATARLTWIFLYGPETMDYLERGKVSPTFGPIVIAFNKTFYYLITILGFVGALILVIKGLKGNYLYFLMSLIPLYVLIVHPIILRYTYNRFLMPAYPFLIVCSAYLIGVVYNRYFHHRLKE
jgi:hypothetical protein